MDCSKDPRIDPKMIFFVAAVSSVATLLIDRQINKLKEKDENWYDFYHYYMSFGNDLTKIIDEMLLHFGVIRGFEFNDNIRVPGTNQKHYIFFENVPFMDEKTGYIGFKKKKIFIDDKPVFEYEAWTGPYSKDTLDNIIEKYTKWREENYQHYDNSQGEKNAICDRNTATENIIPQTQRQHSYSNTNRVEMVD
jgi:hypothetical protein